MNGKINLSQQQDYIAKIRKLLRVTLSVKKAPEKLRICNHSL